MMKSDLGVVESILTSLRDHTKNMCEDLDEEFVKHADFFRRKFEVDGENILANIVEDQAIFSSSKVSHPYHTIDNIPRIPPVSESHTDHTKETNKENKDCQNTSDCSPPKNTKRKSDEKISDFRRISSGSDNGKKACVTPSFRPKTVEEYIVELKAKNVKVLQKELKKASLPTKGLKQELLERLATEYARLDKEKFEQELHALNISSDSESMHDVDNDFHDCEPENEAARISDPITDSFSKPESYEEVVGEEIKPEVVSSVVISMEVTENDEEKGGEPGERIEPAKEDETAKAQEEARIKEAIQKQLIEEDRIANLETARRKLYEDAREELKRKEVAAALALRAAEDENLKIDERRRKEHLLTTSKNLVIADASISQSNVQTDEVETPINTGNSTKLTDVSPKKDADDVIPSSESENSDKKKALRKEMDDRIRRMSSNGNEATSGTHDELILFEANILRQEARDRFLAKLNQYDTSPDPPTSKKTPEPELAESPVKDEVKKPTVPSNIVRGPASFVDTTQSTSTKSGIPKPKPIIPALIKAEKSKAEMDRKEDERIRRQKKFKDERDRLRSAIDGKPMVDSNAKVLISTSSNMANNSASLPISAASESHGGNPVIPAKPLLLQATKQPESKIWRAEDNYPISDKDTTSESGSDDEEDDDRKPIPEWARKENIGKALRRQFAPETMMDPDAIFGDIPHCDLEAIFKKTKNKKFRPRGSSAQWEKDGLNEFEKKTYRKDLGLE